MNPKFKIEPIAFQTIRELPNAWTDSDFKTLLEDMEYGDTSDLSSKELKEMCLLSLSDNEPDEAAKIVLEHIFTERLNEGQIANLSHEMIDEKMWEEYAELGMHEDFFNATQLLYEAYNGKFPLPEAVQFQINITTKDARGMSILNHETEAALVRILVQGMPENTLINRLFDEQIEGGDFKDAKDIIWQYKKEETGGNTLQFSIISSSYWFRDFKYADAFEAELPDLE